MANLFRSCTNVIWSSLLHSSHNHTCNHTIGNIRSLFTSSTLMAKKPKRRKRYPFFWLQDKYRTYYDENLTAKNEQFFQEFLKDKYPISKGISPLKTEPWDVNETFTEGTARTGLIAKKLGVVPMWLKSGRRVLSTIVQVADNHVIKYHPPEEYAKIGRPVDRIQYAGLGCLVVGSDSRDPRVFTAEYNGLFNESGVMPKQKLTRFFVPHKSRIEPGTPLVASHFRPGMYVDVYGLSRDWGFMSLRRRYKLKLGGKTHGVTKQHNRIGSIGRGRKTCGPLKGKKMPGPYGHERVIMPGLKVLRVNTKYNLLYIQGPGLPGLPGTYLNIMDSRMPKKTLTEDMSPPYPTATLEENSKLDEELWDPEINKPSDPSVVFEITEEEKKRMAMLLSRGGAKTAQKFR